MLRVTSFFCQGCQKWTAPDGNEVRCSSCGDYYVCDDCGYEIDIYGTCLRGRA